MSIIYQPLFCVTDMLCYFLFYKLTVLQYRYSVQGFFQLFAQGGGGDKMRLYGLLGSKYIFVCKECGN